MPEHTDAEQSIFHAALSLNRVAQRAEYLDVACRHDAKLRQQVESLLAAHESAASFMQGPITTFSGHTEPHEVQEPSQLIGRYKLLQKIGEGGFGIVYMAEQQQPVIRNVALKVIKLGMDTKQVIARFEAERQALAMMDHPNIAKVLDAGATETGRPYFVMELVRGIPLMQYCDEQRLTTEQRLAVFMDICGAIEHAHQKGIIHRDIKPTNILVTLHDGRPVPKVIDFGIAKATQQRLTDKTLFTRFEQFIGTPLYMSPEQAEMSGLDIDTRSDVYSLGVLLYELLTSRTPFDPKELYSAGHDDIRRRIREQEPPTPSTRLSSLKRDDLTAVAKSRRTDPARLPSLVRGDLDWIVMKAMDKDRTRRYGAASALAEDVGRYLRHETVSAVPPSALYKVQKFARRNKGFLAVVGATAVALVLAATISSWQAIQATLAKRREVAARLDAEAAEQTANEYARVAQLNLYVSDMNLAHNAYLEGNVRRALQLLQRYEPDDGEPDLRGFEWRYLWRLCQDGDALHTFREHSGVTSVAFSPNGVLAAGAVDGKVRLLDMDSRRETATLDAGSAVRSIVFSTDGQRLAVGTFDGRTTFWDIATLKETATLHDEGPIRHLALSPDAKALAVAARSFGIRLWDVETQAEIRTLSSENPDIWQVAYSPDGMLLASAGPGLSVRFWDTEQLRELDSIEEAHTSLTSAIAFSPDGKTLATGSWDTMIHLWDIHTRQRLATFRGHQSQITSLAFSPDGKALVSASWDATVKIWQVERIPRAELGAFATFRGHSAVAYSVAYSPNARTIASGSGDGTVKLWSSQGSRDLNVLAGHDDWVYCVAYSPDDRSLATGSFDGTIRLWDARTREQENTRKAHTYDVFKVAFSSDGQWLASCDSVWRMTSRRRMEAIGEVKLWNIADGQEIRLPGFNTGVRALAFSPDGSIIATGDRVGWFRLWDRHKKRFTFTKKIAEGNIEAIRFSPDGQLLATIGQKNLKLWRISIQEELVTFGASGFSVAFSRDGKMVAGGRSPVKLWDTSTYKELAAFTGHKAQVMGVAFSPDGKTLATGSVDHTVKLWNIETRQEVATLEGHRGPVSCVIFSHDGNTLASSSEDKTVRLWRATETEMAR